MFRTVSFVGVTILLTAALVALGEARTEAEELQSWSQRIDNGARRFHVLSQFNNEAVLDDETQLVWERQPSTQTVSWAVAKAICVARGTGGRGGWRLPSIAELTSLVDLVNPSQNGPNITAGHPFVFQTGPVPGGTTFWSATHLVENPEDPGDFAAGLAFYRGQDPEVPVLAGAINTVSDQRHRFWCVRGQGILSSY